MDDEVGGIDGMTAIQMTSGQRGKILAEIELKNDNIKAVYELQYVKEIFQKFDAVSVPPPPPARPARADVIVGAAALRWPFRPGEERTETANS